MEYKSIFMETPISHENIQLSFARPFANFDASKLRPHGEDSVYMADPPDNGPREGTCPISSQVNHVLCENQT